MTSLLLAGGLVVVGIAAGCDDGYHHRRVSYHRHGGYDYDRSYVPDRVVYKVKNVRNVTIVDRTDHVRPRRDVRPDGRHDERRKRSGRADRQARRRKEIKTRTSRKANQLSRAKVDRKAGRKSKQLRIR